MNLQQTRERLDVGDNHAVKTFLGGLPRTLTWNELEFLLETCNGVHRERRRNELLIEFLDILPPKWEQLVDYANNCLAVEERFNFYWAVFRHMKTKMGPLKITTTEVRAVDLADLMAIIPQYERHKFLPFFQLLYIRGQRSELATVFDNRDLYYMKFMGVGLNYTAPASRVRSWEAIRAETDAAWLKRMREKEQAEEQQRRLQEEQRQAEEQQRRLEEAYHTELARRADEQRKLALHLAAMPADERAAFMSFVREQNGQPVANTQAAIKPVAVPAQIAAAPAQRPMRLDEPVPAQANGPLLVGEVAVDSAAINGQGECAICLTNVARVVFLDCRHQCLCIGCTKTLESRQCPVCRIPITNAIVPFQP